MLKIGITYNSSIKLFYSGFNQTSIILAELFRKLGYIIYFIDISSNDTHWWDYPYIQNITLTQMHKISVDSDASSEEYSSSEGQKFIIEI